MSRRRRGNGPFVAKATPKPTIKAIDMGASDAGIFAGTLADASVQHMPDAEQYYLLFKKHPWVRACVRIIANSVAQEGYDFVPVDGERADLAENDPNVKLLHAYLQQAFIGRSNTFRKWIKATTIDMQVFGWAFTRKKKAKLEVGGEAADVSCYLERLDPRLVHPKLNADHTEIEYFVLKRSTFNYDGIVVDTGSDASAQAAINGEKIPADEIIMFSLDEGGDTVLGSPSPLEALDLTIAMDLNVRQHRNSFFRNGAQVGNAFINTEADEDSVRAAEKQLVAMKVGPRNAFKHIILTGDWDIKALQKQGANDLDFIKGSEIIRDEICAVFSVPPSKLINVSGSMGQAGKGEDDEAFEQECVLPLEENIYQTLTLELLLKEFDVDDLKMVPKRRNKIHADRFDSALKMVKFGATGNQALDFVGLPKSNAPGMDTPLFLGATAGNIAQDEPTDAPAQPAADDLENATEQQDKQNEVAQRAKARFRSPNAQAEAQLSRTLAGIIGGERERLNRVWNDASSRVRKLDRASLTDPRHVLDALGSLDIVNAAAYTAAASAGINAVHQARKASAKTAAEPVADEWMAHVGHYAKKVPQRAADAIAQTAEDLPEDASADAVAAAIDAKIEALRSSITRYAEPPWGTGQQAYGEELGANDVLLDWEIGDDDPCPDCEDLSARSPYARGDVPTWPGAGETVCFDHCHCSIVAEADSWAAAFGD